MDVLNQSEKLLIRTIKSRKVRTLLFILTLFNFSTSFSQNNICDKIIFTNGDEIEAIIKEITPENITYKKCDNIDGPTYVIEKYKIFVVQYKNGSREVITDLVNHNTEYKNQQVITKTKEHGKFYFGVGIGSVNDKSLFESKNDFMSSFNQFNLDFTFNYKLNKIFELDCSLGSGYVSYHVPNVDYGSGFVINTFYYSSNSYTTEYEINGFVGSFNIGPRINIFKLFNEQGFNKINPFLKPEVSFFHIILRPYDYPIKNSFSFNLLAGINIKKHLNFSIGVKFLKLKGYELTYNYNGYSDNIYSKVQSMNFNYNNIIWKFSYEF